MEKAILNLMDALTFDDEEQLEFFHRFRVTRNLTVGKIPSILRFVLWPFIRVVDSALEGYHQLYIAEDKMKRVWWESLFFSINLPILGFYVGWDSLFQIPLAVKAILAFVLYIFHAHHGLYGWLSEKKIAQPTAHRAIDAAIATYVIAVSIRIVQFALMNLTN